MNYWPAEITNLPECFLPLSDFIGRLAVNGAQTAIKSSKNIRPLKVGVLAFAFVSQIAGGYYTDPILWIMYGIVCSNEKTVIN